MVYHLRSNVPPQELTVLCSHMCMPMHVCECVTVCERSPPIWSADLKFPAGFKWANAVWAPEVPSVTGNKPQQCFFFTAHFSLHITWRAAEEAVCGAPESIFHQPVLSCAQRRGTSARSVYDGVTLCFSVLFCEYSWDRKSIATSSPWICIQLVVSQTFSSCENNKVHTEALIRETWLSCFWSTIISLQYMSLIKCAGKAADQ